MVSPYKEAFSGISIPEIFAINCFSFLKAWDFIFTIIVNIIEPLFADAMVARAHALIKTDKYEEAKKDADKAIDILRAGGETSPLISKAFLRSGVASFHLGRYREARNLH